MSSRDGKPEDNAADLNESKESGSLFGIAGCDPPPTFEMQEGVLDQMAQFIEMLIVFSLKLSVLPWRNDRLYSLRKSLRNNGVGIVAAVGQ